jgi:hypothetical protein
VGGSGKPAPTGAVFHCTAIARTAPQLASTAIARSVALKCQSAEELGQRLKQRYQRQRQRAGIAPPSNARVEDELARLLGDRV